MITPEKLQGIIDRFDSIEQQLGDPEVLRDARRLQELSREHARLRTLVEVARDYGLCNVVDVPREGNFIVPALVRRGALTLAISTDGQSPALARRIREELEELYGEEYGDLLHLLGAVRARLLSTSKDSQANKGRFEQLVHSPLLDLMRRKDREGVERMLREVLGEGYSLEDLEISW